jgi:hypothetical protein
MILHWKNVACLPHSIYDHPIAPAPSLLLHNLKPEQAYPLHQHEPSSMTSPYLKQRKNMSYLYYDIWLIMFLYDAIPT